MSGSKLSGFRVASDKPFLIGLGVLGGSYLLIIGAMVLMASAMADIATILSRTIPFAPVCASAADASESAATVAIVNLVLISLSFVLPLVFFQISQTKGRGGGGSYPGSSPAQRATRDRNFLVSKSVA